MWVVTFQWGKLGPTVALWAMVGKPGCRTAGDLLGPLWRDGDGWQTRLFGRWRNRCQG